MIMSRKWVRYILITAGISFLFLNQGFRSLVRNYLELKNIRSQRALLELEQAGLKKEVELANTSSGYIEKAARKELGLIKPGETEYRFPPPKTDRK